MRFIGWSNEIISVDRIFIVVQYIIFIIMFIYLFSFLWQAKYSRNDFILGIISM